MDAILCQQYIYKGSTTLYGNYKGANIFFKIQNSFHTIQSSITMEELAKENGVIEIWL